MLDQIPLASTVRPGIGQKLAHHVNLVVAREYLALLLPPLVVLLLHDLCIVLDDVRQAAPRQALFPQVGGLEALRVRRIPRAVIEPLVEGEEPGILALEMRTHPHLLVVHGEMHHATPELEQQLLRIAVALVLLDRVFDGLFREPVLQLERGHGQAVDEQAQVQGKLRLVLAVAQLTGDAEDIGVEPLLGLHVAGGGRAVEHVELDGPVLDPVPQNVNHAPLGDLALEPVQKLGARGTVLGKVKSRKRLGLGCMDKGAQLGQVHRMVTVVILGIALHVARAAPWRTLFRDPGMHHCRV